MRGQILFVLATIAIVTILSCCNQSDIEPRVSEDISAERVITSIGDLEEDLEPIDAEVADQNDPVDETITETVRTEVDNKVEPQTIDKWTLFEEKLNNSKTLDELFDLYDPKLDGAYAYSYILKLSAYYKNSTPYEFVTMLSHLENFEHALMIAQDLSSGIYGLDEQIYYTGIFSTEISNLLCEDKLSEKQIEIAERLLYYAPDMVKNTPYSETNIFGCSVPLSWECPDGELENYGGGCSWYCSAQIPDIFTTSTLDSVDGRYDAISAYDFNLKTAWSEGAEGTGIGEIITIVVPGNQSPLYVTTIEVVNGYVKSDSTWIENGRVKKLGVSVDGEYLGDILLEDNKTLQRFEIGEFSLEDSSDLVFTYSILEVYPGTKYEDTLITELTLDGFGDH